MALDTEHGGARRGNRWSPAIWGTAAVPLLVPAIAMRFTGQVNWTAGDFVAMGVMLFVACGSYELATRMSGSAAYRTGAAVAIGTAFLTVWVNGAVGMLGSEDNPANLLFGLVILVGVAGAISARLRPQGMARAMQAAALAQAAMTGYALVGGYREVVLHVGLFVIPWLASAQLFRRAGREQARAGAAD